VDAKNILTDKHSSLNENSAEDYIRFFSSLLNGVPPKRTMSAVALAYYLDRISKEYDSQTQMIALSALKQHIATNENHRGGRMHKARQIVEGFAASINTTVVSDEIEQFQIEEITQAKLNNDKKDEIVSYLKGLKPTDSETVVINHVAYKRDNKTVALIKILRDYKCQICQTAIRKKDGRFYIEAAHITPKSNKGLETPDNILILCPNHHKEFDHGDTYIISRDSTHLRFSMNGIKYTVDLTIGHT